MQGFEFDVWQHRVVGGMPVNQDAVVVNLVRHRVEDGVIRNQVLHGAEWEDYAPYEQIRPTLQMPGYLWPFFKSALDEIQKPINVDEIDPEVFLDLAKIFKNSPGE